MDPLITAAPVPRGGLLHRRDGSSSSGGSGGGSVNSTGVFDTCGYLSGDFASPLTCGSGYTCSTGPSLLPSHLGCCNAVDCAPSSGAHTCITAESGTVPCTGDLSSGCIDQYTSLLFCTNPTAPACVTYSQPPPSSGSAASAGLSPTIFSYACGPTQTTHVYLATATNGPASASSTATSSSNHPISISHLPVWAYVCIGIGGLLVLSILYSIIKNCFFPNSSVPPPRYTYQCRHCLSTNLSYRTVQPGNRLGNVGRPYCVCVNNAFCPNITTQHPAGHDRGWVSWTDNIGVQPPGHPPYSDCPHYARKDRAWNGKHFWTCSTGACGYTSWWEDGRQSWGPGF